GRAHAGLESLTPPDTAVVIAAASRGPRPRGRGIVPKTHWPNTFELLQLGRARAGAESSEDCSVSTKGQGLQRGRARAGAESNVTPGNECQLPCASTGPRPRGRGILEQQDIPPLGEALQRGRARAGAES